MPEGAEEKSKKKSLDKDAISVKASYSILVTIGIFIDECVYGQVTKPGMLVK